MSLSNERTKELFGYDLTEITPGMAKKVAAICDDCGCEFTIIRKNMGPLCICKKCAFKRVPRENYKKGIEKRLDTYAKKGWGKAPPRTTEWEANRRAAFEAKFGGPSPTCSPEVLAKTKETNLKKYKTPWAIASPEVRAKSEATMLERHGVRFSRQSRKLQAKAIQTLLSNHGVTNPGASDELKAKAIQTTLDRYGTLNCSSTGEAENKFAEFLESIGLKIIRHFIIPGTSLEIDCYVEDMKIGVEYCGLYYHSEREDNQDPRVHAKHWNKMIKAETAGIRLITLFEDEWAINRKQAEGVLRSIFKKNPTSIGARECSIREISKDEAVAFLATNHLQGADPKMKTAWGLEYAGELISVAAVAANYTANNQDTIVLQRLAFKNGMTVVGGASRLISAVVEWARASGYVKVVTFSDNRWSTGGVYQATGFTCTKVTKYDYQYVDFNMPASQRRRLSKQTQQKQKVNCPPGKTERAWAYERGLRRIWHCGHKHWELKL